MVSPSFGVGETEPSRATRGDEGSARRDDLLPQTGLGIRAPLPIRKASQSGKSPLLACTGSGAVARRSSRGSAPTALLRLWPSENRSPPQGAPGGALHGR